MGFLRGVAVLWLAVLLPLTPLAWSDDSDSVSDDSSDSGSIVMQITAIESSTGNIVFTLHDNEKSFPSDESAALRQISVPAEQGTTTAMFDDVPYGDYAVAAYHDEDGNGKLKLMMGFLPREGTAMSNDARANRGPPKYSDAVFSHQQCETRLQFTMNY